MLWPLGMMFPFVNVKNVARNILGWEGGKKSLLVVAGEQDALMGVTLMRKMAEVYKGVVERLLPSLKENKDEKEEEEEEDECWV